VRKSEIQGLNTEEKGIEIRYEHTKSIQQNVRFECQTISDNIQKLKQEKFKDFQVLLLNNHCLEWNPVFLKRKKPVYTQFLQNLTSFSGRFLAEQGISDDFKQISLNQFTVKNLRTVHFKVGRQSCWQFFLQRKTEFQTSNIVILNANCHGLLCLNYLKTQPALIVKYNTNSIRCYQIHSHISFKLMLGYLCSNLCKHYQNSSNEACELSKNVNYVEPLRKTHIYMLALVYLFKFS
jgi:hypothetical protein